MTNGIYGSAAAGLQNASWAKNDTVASIGAAGEHKSAALLDGFGKKAAVLHDLRIPIPNISANIDHVVVTGRRVLILDTKVWKPGFYWTLGGTNRRGFERVDHTNKKTMVMAREALERYLKGTGAVVAEPRVIIWPSRAGQKLSTWLLQVPGARTLPASRLVAAIKSFITAKEADPAIVQKLSALLNHPSTLQPKRHFANTSFLEEGDPFAQTPARTGARRIETEPDPFA